MASTAVIGVRFMGIKKQGRWTESKVFQMLAKRFPSPAFVLLPQVRNGTGFARKRNRTADAIAASTWPSRGLFLAGIEIKVTFSDWRKELSQPWKADDIQKYCRYWYVAAPKGVVPVSEVPDTWGLIECTATQAKETKAAPQMETHAPDMLLVASILRTCQSVMVPVDDIKAREKAIQDRCKEQAEQAEKAVTLERDLKNIRETVSRFEDASGLKLDRWHGQSLGEAVRIVETIGIDGAKKAGDRLKDQAQRIIDILSRDEREDQWTS